MTVKVAINGFGRIGRTYLRAAHDMKDFEIIAINDLTDAETLAHLLKYDTIMGKFDGTVKVEGEYMKVNDDKIKVLQERDPAKLPWKEMDVDIIIESTGLFRKPEDASKHIAAGARKVLVSAPGKGDMFTVVLGVNEDEYDPEKHHIISNASCTTNCLAPLVKVLDKSFGIQKGLMTTIHAVTNDQRILDLQHGDLRRARAACWNIIPTTTGAAKAIGLVYPAMIGKLDGMAIRVPVMDVSVVDLVANLERKASVDEINEAFKKAADGEMKGYLQYADEPLVSSDYIGNPHSCIYDSLVTNIQDDMVKVLGWYDNEAGYSYRLADLTALVAKKL
ncbi:MAG: glyceraldehyde-3-phosphate dehydrogenase A [Candidatus Thorarchaeota archaeon]|nr:MAG: glyceraldehyde-3-phosphate dehydrogenase A [Candidatus Thorarchaeota archaeon]